MRSRQGIIVIMLMLKGGKTAGLIEGKVPEPA